MPTLFTFGTNYYPLVVRKVYSKIIDQGWFEYYGGQNLYKLLKKTSRIFQLFSSNHLKIYLILILILVFVVFIYNFIYLNSLYVEHNSEEVKEIDNF